MAKKRKDKDGPVIKLKQPDRSRPTDQTLLGFAQERNLFQQAEERERQIKKSSKKAAGKEQGEDGEMGLSPRTERVMESILWTVSLSMLHFTLDVLVQHQYAMDIDWWEIVRRAMQAFIVFFLLFYNLHPHPSDTTFLPLLPSWFQTPLRQAIFFVISVGAGCYLIYVSSRHGYLAVMSRAPPLGCLWIWSVIELDLPVAVLSLACAGGFFWQGGYGIR